MADVSYIRLRFYIGDNHRFGPVVVKEKGGAAGRLAVGGVNVPQVENKLARLEKYLLTLGPSIRKIHNFCALPHS